MTTITEKRCGKCKETRPLELFYRNAGLPDGRGNWCGKCSMEYQRERATGHPRIKPLVPRRKPPEEPEGHKWCPVCDAIRPFEDFSASGGHRHGRALYCRECERVKQRESAARRRTRNPEAREAKQARDDHQASLKRIDWTPEQWAHYREIRNRSVKKRIAELRVQIRKFLGEKCIDCGFADARALQIDHVHGGGSKERKRYQPRTYLKRILASIQAGEGKYELRCCNCNWIKRYTNNELGLDPDPDD